MNYIDCEKLKPKYINLKLPDNKVRGKGKQTFYNIAISFDTETTSTYIDEGEKFAFVYVWMVAVEEDVYIGRKIDTLVDFINQLSVQNNSTENENVVVIYCHNLSFDFQFIRKYFEWLENCQLSVDTRKIVKARTTNGIEFRCSYLESNKPLKDLPTVKYKKSVGDLDYNLIRHYKTPINEIELGYCINDVLVLTEYIQQEMDYFGDISKIPTTSTGVVRRFCRDNTLYCKVNDKQYMDKSYSQMIKRLTLEPEEYSFLKEAFQGGFTHASFLHSGHTMDNVTSYDFTSSYPAVMLLEQFPIGKGTLFTHTKAKRYIELCKLFCVVANITFIKLCERDDVFEHPLSFSKCRIKGSCQLDNGRIVKADEVNTTLTEQDFKTIMDFYTFTGIRINGGYYYDKGYLPKQFIKCILDLYEAKTSLKDVKGSEDEYMRKKAMLNSCYGMIVTDIVKPEIKYIDGNWIETEVDLNKAINNYNKSKSRFLFYAWGIWVTAYARRNLFTGIKECGSDFIYADTDSIKIINADKHMDYINSYNDEVKKKTEKVCKALNIDTSRYSPKTIKGKDKPIGVWDYDGHYKKFKTLGAKRYMYEDDEDIIHITISGVRKKDGANYMKQFKNPFDEFKNSLYFPPEYTGKQTHTYIDETKQHIIKDYLGQEVFVQAKSGTHLEGCGYDLSLSYEYIQFIKDITRRFYYGKES